MSKLKGKKSLFLAGMCCLASVVVLISSPVFAAGYDKALQGVQSYDVVYEVSLGDPKVANLVFWAVQNSYEAADVKSLPGDPNVVIVFHGPVVKLLSTDRAPFNAAEWAQVEKFQETLTEMKKAGIKLEVCLYAAKVLGVDKATIVPEVDHVDNGFVSVIGYQMQDYAVVRIP